MSARRVDNDDVEALGAELLDALERDGHRIRFSVTARARGEEVSFLEKKMSVSRSRKENLDFDMGAACCSASPSKERDFGADGVLFQLVESAGSERVGADERDLEPSSLVVSRELDMNSGGSSARNKDGYITPTTAGGRVTFVQVVVFPAPWSPTIMMTWDLPLTGCARHSWVQPRSPLWGTREGYAR